MFDYPNPPVRTAIFSTRLHALWDYLVSVALISSPWLLGFSTDEEARWPIVTAGMLVLLLAIVTDYEGGVFKRILMLLHLGFDRLIGSLLGASPWLLGFANRVYLPHFILGLLLLLMGLLTERKPVYKQRKFSK